MHLWTTNIFYYKKYTFLQAMLGLLQQEESLEFENFP